MHSDEVKCHRRLSSHQLWST